MPFRRRREETLNEKLLREAGVETGPAPEEPIRWGPERVLGMPWHRPGYEPDLGAELVADVDAPDVAGDRVRSIL